MSHAGFNAKDCTETPPGVGSSELLCRVGASIPSKKFGVWIVNDVRGSRTRLLSGNLKAEVWAWTEQIESILQEIKRHNE